MKQERLEERRDFFPVCVSVCVLGFHQIKQLFIWDAESKHLLLSILPCDPSHCHSLREAGGIWFKANCGAHVVVGVFAVLCVC